MRNIRITGIGVDPLVAPRGKFNKNERSPKQRRYISVPGAVDIEQSEKHVLPQRQTSKYLFIIQPLRRPRL